MRKRHIESENKNASTPVTNLARTGSGLVKMFSRPGLEAMTLKGRQRNPTDLSESLKIQ